MNDQRPLLLLVDDDPDIRTIIGTKLREEGFEVAEAADGSEGMEKARQLKPALVILDVKMPGMSGTETLMNMQADPELRRIRVVFLTNYGAEDAANAWLDTKFAKEIGAIGHIRKTDDLKKIVAQIQESLSSEGPASP